MKKIVLAISILLANSPVLAVGGVGDIVFDPTQYAQKAAQWAEEIQKWENQIKLYQQQIALLKGSKKYGMTPNQVHSNLPTAWEEFLPYAAADLNHTQKINNNKTEFLLNQYGLMVNAFNESKNRLERIQNLVSAINQAEGPKESQDLNNRLQTEMLLMQENQNRLKSINQIMEMEEKLADHQKWLKRKCYSIFKGNKSDPRVSIPEECQNFANSEKNRVKQSRTNSQTEYIGDNGGWNLGQTSEKYESGGKGPGVINGAQAAAQDKGGWSYGKYQIATNTGTMDQYLKASKYKDEFKGMKPGTPEFNARWKEVAKKDPKGFAEDQHKFIQKTHYEKQIKLLKKNGIDLSNRGPAIQDLVWSTSVQHGGNTNKIKDALKGKDVSQMSNDQIIDAVQDRRIIFYKKEADKDIRKSLLNRGNDERKRLHELNKNGVR
ncbi:MAG: type IV secretion system protein [Neisseriaceae bacterium]|nr:type IV secretion system protein [Neisseriaceae bacterium]